MTTDLMPAAERDAAAALEQVVIAGDLDKLTPAERVSYYRAVCESMGLNPLTKPFDYLRLNNRLTLYATKTATDQLRGIRGISVTKLERELTDDIYTVTAYGTDRSGRMDSAMGAVSVKGVTGENRANAYMKAETKAKRRLTLSLSGLGWLDEVDIESVPSASRTDVDMTTGEIVKEPPRTLVEKIAERKAEVTEAPPTQAVPGEGGQQAQAEGTPPAAEAETAATAPAAVQPLKLHDFRAWQIEAKVPDAAVKEFAAQMFPERKSLGDLSDEERGQLALSLE